MTLKKILIIGTLLPLSACANSTFDPVEHYLAKRNLSPPSTTQFQSCRGYGCQFIDTIILNEDEWAIIDAPFKRKAKTPKDERDKIIKSIAEFETIVGTKNGTSKDVWGTFQKTGHTQLDCVDESTNTSMYMLALQKRGHIHHHIIGTPQARVSLRQWPHQTATLIENETKQVYAIDSWFYNNGEPPRIIEFETWKDGWSPRKLERLAQKQRAEKAKSQ
ncbi:MAG: hypothetical protein AB8B83_07600 [Bdellovibrionales bacterium]